MLRVLIREFELKCKLTVINIGKLEKTTFILLLQGVIYPECQDLATFFTTGNSTDENLNVSGT